MITNKQFKKLKVGDIILFNGRPRTIRDINWIDTAWGGRGFITFSILRRSWTGRISTTYCYNEIRDKLSLPKKERDKNNVCKAEESALVKSGFNVTEGIERELDDNAGRKWTRKDSIVLLKKCRRKIKRRKRQDNA